MINLHDLQCECEIKVNTSDKSTSVSQYNTTTTVINKANNNSTSSNDRNYKNNQIPT